MEPAAQVDLPFSFDEKKTLTPSDQSTFIKAFRNYDKNGDGTMDQNEFKNIMIDMGYRKITDEKVKELLAAQDQNKDGVISWQEFKVMMINMKGSDDGKFGQIVEGADGKQMAKLESAHGGLHAYSIEERHSFANLINVIMKDDPQCQDRLPMNADNEDLFHVFDNGVLMNKMLLQIEDDCIDPRALTVKESMSVFEVQGNLKMGIAAAKGIGIKLIGVDAKDFIDKTPHMVLTFVWQALRAIVAKKITLKDTPEIMRLAEEGEELKDLMKLPVETILIRWINFHLNKAGQTRRVKNLGKDIADSFALFHVLNQLDKDKCSLDGIDNDDLSARAGQMIANSQALGVPTIVGPGDITAANVKINTLFVAYIFNTKHGLEELTEEEYAAAAMIDDDIEGTREERAFRLWINSLNLEGVYIDNLFDECRDGVILCKVVDKIWEGTIDWKKVDMNPKNDFGRNINNNQAIDGSKKRGLKLVAVGGVDITKGNRTPILALVWQLVRAHYLKLIGGKTDAQLVEWANNLVGGGCPPINDLKDKTMASSKFKIHMLAALEPRAVNWDLVTEGETDEDKCQNAKYAISIARRLGAIIFCVWEDFVNVNPKQMLIFFATMNEIQAEMEEAKKSA